MTYLRQERAPEQAASLCICIWVVLSDKARKGDKERVELDVGVLLTC